MTRRRFDPWRFVGFLLCVGSAVVFVGALWVVTALWASLELGWP